MFRKSLLIIAVIIISGASGIVADRFLFPRLAGMKWFSKSDFLKKSLENTTVINKTEQIFVKEDSSINKIAASNASSVVNIISYPETNTAAVRNKNAPQEVKNGTGTIITSDGFIMTYLTAISPENFRYKVLTSDGSAYDAELAGIDSFSNLAFFKISASNLATISFANSDDEKPGEKIIAIGNDNGNYQNEFSLGLLKSFNPYFNLSGKTVSSSEKLEGVFEMDIDDSTACVGGPAIDYAGQAIGIVGSIVIDGKGRHFIIPANKVKKVIDRAIKKELDKNPVLGLYYTPINKTFALEKNLDQTKGVLIYSPSGQQGLAVITDSPAARAGIRINDIITKVGEDEINEINTFSDLVHTKKSGEKLELTVVRDGAEIKIPVEI